MAEISDRESLEKWLSGKPKAVSVAIATRAALRVFPALVGGFDDAARPLSHKAAQDIILPLCRVMAMPWVAATIPTHGIEVEQFTAAVTAARAATATATATAAVTATAARAATAAVTAARAATATAAVTATAARAATAAVTATAARAATADAATATAAIWREIEVDCHAVQSFGDGVSDGRVPDLVRRPLWHGEALSLLFQAQRETLFAALLKLDNDWDVWEVWYENRVAGNLLSDDEELCYVTFTEDEWDAGPQYINREIRKRLAAVRAGQGVGGEEADEQLLAQRPATHSFLFENNKIVASPQIAQSTDQLRSMIWTETLRKAQEACDRLLRTQAPKHIVDTFDRLNSSLGQTAEDVQPGMLLMHSRSIDAIWNAYTTPEARSELGEDAVAMLDDAKQSIDDLKATYPEISALEATRLAQNLSDRDVEEASVATTDIIETAKDNDLIDETAISALESADPEIEETGRIASSSSDDQVRARALENRNKLTAGKLQTLRNFTSATLKVSGRWAQEYAGKAGRRAEKASLDALEVGMKAGIVVLLAQISLPLGALASVSMLFRGLKEKADELTEDLTENDEAKASADNDGEGDSISI